MFNLDPDSIESIEIIKKDESFEYHITLKIQSLHCPYCGGCATSNGKHKRKITHTPLKDFKGTIYWFSRRYKCKECNSTFIENNPFTFPGFNISFSTMKNIMLDLKKLNFSYKDIAERNDVSITQVQKYFYSFINIPGITLPESLGIDEIHSNMAKYSSAYLCIMVDNENRVLFEILPSRSKNTISNYLSMIDKKERDNVKYVTIDMWVSYKEIAQTYFKNCIIAVDPFHVIKNLTHAFTKIRTNIQNQVERNSDTYYLLKNWHYLFEVNKVDL